MKFTPFRTLTATICCIIALACPVTIAQEISGASKTTIDEFWVLIDTEHNLNEHTALLQPIDKWIHHQTPNLNLGYNQATIWVKINLNNQTDKSISRLLDITYPLLDSTNVYAIHANNIVKPILISGDTLPFSSKNIKHPNHVSMISVQGQSSNNYLIKIKSNSPIQTQFIVWDVEEFQDHYRALSGFNFLYLGLIIGIVIFNLFIYLFLKETVYLVYSAYAASFALLMGTQNAILFEYLYPEHPSIHNWSQLTFAILSISLTGLFNYYFLKLKPSSLAGKILIAFSIIPLILFSISPLIGYAAAIKTTVIGALAIVPLTFLVGIFNSNKHNDQVYYILAWGWLTVGAVIFLMSKLGVIPFNALTTHSILIGSALELFTFTIALAKRIHTERETRIHAQKILIENSKRTAMLHSKMLHNATHHTITGLPNRAAIESWIDENKENLNIFEVVFVRLSRITDIDKTLGKRFSEEALLVFSQRLQLAISTFDGAQAIESNPDIYVATINSNTHCFIKSKDHENNLEEQLSLLKESISSYIPISDMEIDPYLTFSYANYPQDGEDAASLLRHADIAIDQASPSEQGIVKYDPNIDPYSERRLNMMSDLTKAIYSDKLTLHFQPIVDTNTKEILGAEALIRWPHEKYGLIMPDQFIQPAEQAGVIQALSLWVLRNAIKQQLQWIKVRPSFLLSVNISAFNLQDKKFIEAVHILFNEHKNLARNIILEITETQMMTDTHHALKNLWQLSELGFHIAIDDFGTGYSNLAYLKQLPANELKIDKSFILNIESDKQNQTLVQTAIHMAHNLGLKVVAEGVESERSRIILSEMGCDWCQGYHFSRPVPADDFNQLLND